MRIIHSHYELYQALSNTMIGEHMYYVCFVNACAYDLSVYLVFRSREIPRYGSGA